MKTLDQITPASCDELSALSQQQTNGGIDNVSLAKIPITFPFPIWPISGPIKLPPIKIPVPMPLPYDPVMDY
ncbi:hypothetical protein [Spirosoma rhododendri]|uniref:Uncharacterized protein n=1 Tax=Spirosoma rhododendri TaxID=2728024 RepID=A0A7L5DSD0_9BACT|nr:hypothetical protein [Spirosoma rhododendri]QJD81045.1 hypothetical protein HH216_23430 [Spirosoma rhododendri]